MNPWSLTDREVEMLSQIAQSGSAKKAARVLGVSDRTVEEYVRRARRKMNVAHTILAVLMLDRLVNARMDNYQPHQ